MPWPEDPELPPPETTGERLGAIAWRIAAVLLVLGICALAGLEWFGPASAVAG